MKRRVVASLALTCCAMTVCPSGHAADTSDRINDYANKLSIAVPATSAGGAQGLFRMELPPVVYRGIVHGDLRDLRVFNAAGERVPFALTIDPARVTTAAAESKATVSLPFFPLTEAAAGEAPASGISLSVKIQGDGTLLSLQTTPRTNTAGRRVTGYLVDASRRAGSPGSAGSMTALDFDWVRSVDTQVGRVSIEASNDLNNWRMIAPSAPLIDTAFNGARLSQTRVTFPPLTDKYLRLTWARQAFVLNKLSAESSSGPPERTLETMKIPGVAGPESGSYLFALPARVGVERVRMLLPDENTLAPTQLSVRVPTVVRRPGGHTETVLDWQPVTSATFYRMTRDGVEMVSPPVAISSTAARGATEWRAVVDGRGGGIGAGIPTLELSWQPQQLVFAARGASPFTLAFGRHDATPAAFTIRELIPGYKSGDEMRLLQASTMAAPDHPIIAGIVRASNDTNWKKIGLWAVLIVGVAMLAWMAYRLSRSKPKA